MHSLHRSRLATLALARVPITQRYSAKKARYSHNRAAVYSGWPESPPWLSLTCIEERDPALFFFPLLCSLLFSRGARTVRHRRDTRRCIVTATMNDGHSSSSNGLLSCRLYLRYYTIQAATYNNGRRMPRHAYKLHVSQFRRAKDTRKPLLCLKTRH